MTGVDWASELLEQLSFHWTRHLRPRLDGLTDDEYRWEPVPGAWNVRPNPDAPDGAPATIDFTFPEPDPPPITTIAWRLGHVIVGVFAMRNASHFGGPPIDYQTAEWSLTAAGALGQLDDAHARWVDGVRQLGADGRLGDPVGEAEGPYADRSYATLVLHIHREAIHHGAEILVLRDLYRGRYRPPA